MPWQASSSHFTISIDRSLFYWYLDGAPLPEDDGDSIHIDHHGSDVGDFFVASPVLVLGVHGKVRQIGGSVARLGKGVRAGSHVVMSLLVIGHVVGIAIYWAYAIAWSGRRKCAQTVSDWCLTTDPFLFNSIPGVNWMWTTGKLWVVLV